MTTPLLRCATVGAAMLIAPITELPRPGTQDRDGDAVAIEHVSVVPMDRERVVEDQTVIVSRGTIRWVGPARLARVPRAAARIDGRGAFVAPGLMDLHVHLYDGEGLLAYLAHGVTTILVMHGSPEVLAWRKEVASGRRDGPAIHTTGPTLDGNRPLNSQFVALDSPADARAEVAAQRRSGYDAVKVYGALRPEVFRAVIAAARAAHLPVLGHVNRALGADSVMASGQTMVAHAFEFGPTAFGDALAGDTDAFARRVKRHGITVAPNLLVNRIDREAQADGGAWRRDPAARVASPAAFSEKLPSVARSTQRADTGYAAYLSRVQAFQYALTRSLHRAGVPLVLGTDTEIYGFPGTSAVRELEELVAAGLRPFDALATGTRDAGRFLARSGMARQAVGTVTAGSRADLVLLDANPLVHPAAYDRPIGVLAAGRWHSRETLERSLAERAAAYAPVRALAARLDSLAIGEDGASMVAVLDSALGSRRPSDPPLVAEVPLREYARRRAGPAPAFANRLREIATRLYPHSFSALDELAAGLFDAGDLAGARRENARSLALQPRAARARDMRRMLEASSRPPSFATAGRYVVERLPASGGAAETSRDTIAVVAKGPSHRATIGTRGGGTAARVLAAGGDQLWILAGDFLATEYRLRLRGDSVAGDWVGNYGTGGRLRGRRLP